MDTLITIGDYAPSFELSDLEGKPFALAAWRGRIVVLNFWSAECNWCRRVDRELLNWMLQWGDQVVVAWIAANSNEDLDLLKRTAMERHIPEVLIDAGRKVADLYGAQTTPHFFVIDRQGKLRYQGAWDDITFRQRSATRVYVPEVIEALVNDQPVEISQTAAYGCTIMRFT
jgi:peroxiredoxin